MKNYLKTEEEVKRQLGISDFRNLKKEQLIEFVSMIPEMNKEVAKACIDQFPNFKDYSTEIVGNLYSLMGKAIEMTLKDQSTPIRVFLMNCEFCLKKEYVSENERQYIIDKVIEIADRIVTVEDKKRVFVQKALNIASTFGVIAIAAGGTLLGLKFRKK